VTLRISLAQITSSSDPAANLATVEKHVNAAVDAGSRLVVFPEATMQRFGGPLAHVAQPLDGRWADAVRECAARAGITVVAGMFTPADDGRVRNTLLVTGGGVDTHYDKIHLFDAFGFAESDTVAPGGEPLVVTVEGVGIGLAACYDIRFPGLFQTLADRGAALTVVAASWGAGPGKVDQWTLLARARALDSTTFVAACDPADPATSGETAHDATRRRPQHRGFAHGSHSGTTRFQPGNIHRRHRHGPRHTGSRDSAGTGESAVLTTARTPDWHVCHERVHQGLYYGGHGGLSRTLTKNLRTGRGMRLRRRSARSRPAPLRCVVGERPTIRLQPL
jgi:predicted amidohydrolase